jgi:hypothetical protein
VGIQIPDIQIPDTFENRTKVPVFEWLAAIFLKKKKKYDRFINKMV